MNESKRMLLSGDEAIALAARHAGVALGAGYPGTPSTEILEAFSEYGVIFQKPARPEYPYKPKSQSALQRHLIWMAIAAAIVASLWTGTILFG